MRVGPALLDESCDAVDEDAGFPRARAGEDEKRAVAMFYGFLLSFVQ